MGENKSAFERGPKQRPLRVVVDMETVESGDALDVLLGLMRHEALEFATTRDVAGASRIEIDAINDEGTAPVRIFHPGGNWTYTGVAAAGHYQDVARWVASEGESPEEEALRACLLCAAARNFGADSFITGSDLLLYPTHATKFAARGNPMTLEEGVALVGLFLRCREVDFTFEKDAKSTTKISPSTFYSIAAEQLLPSGWTWRMTCATAAREGRPELLGLAFSPFDRLSRALRARDRLHEHRFMPVKQRGETEEVLFYFDVVLLMLGAAFDVVAGVAHHVYKLPGEIHNAGWRRKYWPRDLAKRDPVLAEVMAPGRPARDALELTATLRNRIHGEPLRGVTIRRRGEPLDYVIEIPTELVPKITESASRLGGPEWWGIEPHLDRVYVDPGEYAEALIPAAGRALDELMQGMDVGRLGVAPSPERPPEDGWWGKESMRKRVRLLAGLDDAAEVPWR